MNREEEIEIIIVNLFRNLLNISDDETLLEIYKSIQIKDLVAKERILTDLKENMDSKNSIFSDLGNEIILATNKIIEKAELFIEKWSINTLLT